jgi:hypothetical protein
MTARTQGFPAIGRTIPAAGLTAVTLLVGSLASWVVIGVSGWLVIALLLTIGAAAVPRGAFAAILTTLLASALVIDGFDGYTGRFVVLLAAAHLLFVVASLSAWLPRNARVQLRVLRPSLLRYLAAQIVAQLVSFVVLVLVAPHNAPGTATAFGWLGVVGGVGCFALAVVALLPALLRPSR